MVRPTDMTLIKKWSIGGSGFRESRTTPKKTSFSPRTKKHTFSSKSTISCASCAPKIIFGKIPIFKMLFRMLLCVVMCALVTYIVIEMASQRSGASSSSPDHPEILSIQALNFRSRHLRRFLTCSRPSRMLITSKMIMNECEQAEHLHDHLVNNVRCDYNKVIVES